MHEEHACKLHKAPSHHPRGLHIRWQRVLDTTGRNIGNCWQYRTQQPPPSSLLRMGPTLSPTSQPPSKSTTCRGWSAPTRTLFPSACTVARRESGSRWSFCSTFMEDLKDKYPSYALCRPTKCLYCGPRLYHSERIMFNLQNEENWQLIIQLECNLLGQREPYF